MWHGDSGGVELTRLKDHADKSAHKRIIKISNPPSSPFRKGGKEVATLEREIKEEWTLEKKFPSFLKRGRGDY